MKNVSQKQEGSERSEKTWNIHKYWLYICGKADNCRKREGNFLWIKLTCHCRRLTPPYFIHDSIFYYIRFSKSTFYPPRHFPMYWNELERKNEFKVTENIQQTFPDVIQFFGFFPSIDIEIPIAQTQSNPLILFIRAIMSTKIFFQWHSSSVCSLLPRHFQPILWMGWTNLRKLLDPNRRIIVSRSLDFSI